jgi:glucan phosphoethanolaminetransferase (alkaline phosphatase superfamily)
VIYGRTNPSPMRRYSPIAAMLLLECLFWGPLAFVPLAARGLAGDPLSLKDFAACVSLSAALWVVGTHFGRFQPAYRFVLYSALGFGSLVVTGVTLSNNGLLSPLSALAIVDTNASEATEFVRGKFDLDDILLCSLLLVPAAALAVQTTQGLFFGRVRFALAAIVSLFVVQIGTKDVTQFKDRDMLRAASGQKARSENDPLIGYAWWLSYPAFDRYPPLQPYYALGSAIQIRHEIAQLATTARPLQQVHAVEKATGKPRAYVVVIGESLTRHHMHLYGYPRDTTPELDRLAKTGELLVFRDVVTSHALTVPALLSILRFPSGHEHAGQTVFDIFNGGAFQTYWISNQYQYGAFESAVSLLTASARERVWLNQPLQGRYEERRNFDSVVVNPLRNIIHRDKGDKVIFIHLLGDHFNYRSRFPDSAAYFNGAEGSSCRTPDQNQLSNDYDSSVRFNDSVMGKIITTMREFDGESFVLYFSDHGEEVYDWRDFFDHDDSMLSPYLAEIPFVLWLSDAYRSAHPAFTAQVTRATNRPFITSDLIDTVTDLARLSFPGMDESHSLFSDKFMPHRRITADRDYDAFKADWAPDNVHAGGAKLFPCTEAAALKNPMLHTVASRTGE